YFWMNRYDGRIDSLACRSRRPHHHPNEHNPAELKLIRAFRRANAEIGLLELWFNDKACFFSFEDFKLQLRRHN
ncbi:MAG: hypothetical protein WA116_02885, partial [Anaerolineaceae bacterium]